MRRLFEEGAYSRAALNRSNTVQLFLDVKRYHVIKRSKGHCNWSRKTFGYNEPTCQVWCLQVSWKQRYGSFQISRDTTRSKDQNVIALTQQKFSIIMNHPARFGVYRSQGSGDIAAFRCHVIPDTRNQKIKRSLHLVNKNLLL